MAKKSMDKLGIMNMMADAAHKKAQKPKFDPDQDGDDDSSPAGDADKDFAGKKKFSGKQYGAMKAKKKAAFK